MLWKVAVPGEGHASPIVIGNRVIVSTADEQAETRSVYCYDRETGTQLWNTPFHRGAFMFKNNKNSHASPTPVSDGVHIYLPYIAGDKLWLTAIALTDGRIIWQPEIGPFVSQWGYASSPVLYKELVIVVGDNKGLPTGNVVEPTSYLVAVDRKTGKIAWRVPRILAPSYASPVVAFLAGRDQLLLGGAERITAYDPATGKELWFCRWSGERAANSVVWGDNRVYASVNWPSNEIVCVRADGSGDVTDSHVVWRQTRNAADVSAPLYHEGRLYVITDQGICSCLDGATGEPVWQNQRLGGNVSSSAVLVGDRILVTDETGTTHVLQAGPAFKRLARNPLNERVLASPALSGDRLFIRGQRYLWCLAGQSAVTRPAIVQPADGIVLVPDASGRVVPAARASEDERNTTIVVAGPKSGANRSYSMILPAALLLLFMLSLGGVLLIVHIRRANEPLEATEVVEIPEEEPVPKVISFACGGCGKSLRGNPNLAGKKVKCPRCSTAVFVPGRQEPS